MMNKIAL